MNSEFAKAQLVKHGWQQGQGLGKNDDGMKEAIKVKLKNDTAGVGHRAGDEFHWWDHIFNKAASSIQIKDGEAGPTVQKISDCTVSSKRPLTKTLANKELLYGRFVKASTLHNDGKEVKESSTSDSDLSDSEDDETQINKLTDEDLLRICGGRTAHKGARHGLKQSGKLARIEHQESACSSKNVTPEGSDDENSTKKNHKMVKTDNTAKARKDKKRKRTNEVSEVNNPFQNEKSPSKSEEEVESDVLQMEKKSKKRKKSKKEKLECDNEIDDSFISIDTEVANTQENNEDNLKRMKKKQKKSKKCMDEESCDENSCSTDRVKDKKRKMVHDEGIAMEEVNIAAKPESEKSKKKKKSKKEKNEQSDEGIVVSGKEEMVKDTDDSEIDGKKKKKKKKSKRLDN